MDQNGEIEAEDCVNILESMMGEADEIEDAHREVGDADADSAGGPGSASPAHDRIVNLQAFAACPQRCLHVLHGDCCVWENPHVLETVTGTCSYA